MRIDVPWAISIVIGALVGLALVLLLSGRPDQAPRQSPPADAQTKPVQGEPVRPRGSPSPSPTRVTPAPSRQMVPGNRLREAQEEYLTVLLRSPGDQRAMAELIAVQRQLAKDDPVVLRRRAAALQDAITRGVETEEHYTADAMMILVQANLLAADEIEQARGIASGPVVVGQNVTPRASIQTARSNPTPRPTARTRRRATPQPPRAAATPAPVVRPPTAAPATVAPPPATPAPQASLDVNEPFFMVQIGPISDAARASEIAAELTLGGYAARVSRPAGGNNYFIILGPYRQSVADAIVKTIRTRYAGLAVAVTPAP